MGFIRTITGTIKREDLDKILSGEPPLSMNERLMALRKQGKI
jgi:hypothetical protein